MVPSENNETQQHAEIHVYCRNYISSLVTNSNSCAINLIRTTAWVGRERGKIGMGGTADGSYRGGGSEQGRAVADVGSLTPAESRSTPCRMMQRGRQCVWEKTNIFIF